MKHIVIIFFFCLAMFSCSDDFTDNNDSQHSIVIDGYIENGKYAKVAITFPIEINAQLDSSSYAKYINTRAKVSISNGTTSEILTLKKDNAQIPPYFYVSTRIKGETNKTYFLEVIYQTDTITAETTIPEKIEIDSIWMQERENDTVQKYLWIAFQDNPEELNYYRFFTKITNTQSNFYPTKTSTFFDEDFSSNSVIQYLYKGTESLLDTNTQKGFNIGDTIIVKATTIDNISGEFWKKYDKEASNKNPFSNGENLPSNIQGGLGIWCGYNYSTKQIVVE